jgi:hypothetical protein
MSNTCTYPSSKVKFTKFSCPVCHLAFSRLGLSFVRSLEFGSVEFTIAAIESNPAVRSVFVLVGDH